MFVVRRCEEDEDEEIERHVPVCMNLMLPSTGLVAISQDTAFKTSSIDLDTATSPFALSGDSVRVFAPSTATLKKWSLSVQVRDQQGFFDHFYPSPVARILLKNALLTFSTRLREVQSQIQELQEEEEEEIEAVHLFSPSNHRHELSIWRSFGSNLRFGVARDLAVYTLQRVFELVSLSFVSKKTFMSLVKNASLSAVRKAERYSGLEYFEKVAQSASKSSAFYWLAFFTFYESYDFYQTYYTDKKTTSDAIHHRSTFLKRMKRNGLRCFFSCIFSGLGAGLGSCIRPGHGTLIGSMVGQHCANLVF